MAASERRKSLNPLAALSGIFSASSPHLPYSETSQASVPPPNPTQKGKMLQGTSAAWPLPNQQNQSSQLNVPHHHVSPPSSSSGQSLPPPPNRQRSSSALLSPPPNLFAQPASQGVRNFSQPQQQRSGMGSAFSSSNKLKLRKSDMALRKNQSGAEGISTRNISTTNLAPPIPNVPSPSKSDSNMAKLNKRKSWLPGSRASKEKNAPKNKGPSCWIMEPDGQKTPYDPTILLNGQNDQELWRPDGNTYVYLFPRGSGRGPSFFINSQIFSCSSKLARLVHGDVYSHSNDSQSIKVRPSSMEAQARYGTSSPPPGASSSNASRTEGSDESRDSRGLFDVDNSQPMHLYLPVGFSPEDKNDDNIEPVIAIRNMFSFLHGQSLLGTTRRPNVFTVFWQISSLLQEYGFSNLDGTTFGETADSSFNMYVEELKIADVRGGVDRIVEGLLLGERMRSVGLYNEAFVHAVGRYDELNVMKSAKLDKISRITLKRLERAHMDLENRLKVVNLKLQNFDFEQLFYGVMNSRTTDARKHVNFDHWKTSFNVTRKWLLGVLKDKYAAWPPKARSKKNDLETDGLNRKVLRQLERDCAALYDLLVDRTSMTNRGIGEDEAEDERMDPRLQALRHVLGEYDRSTPPVLPPVPFDVPMLPALNLKAKKASKDNGSDSDSKSKKKVGSNQLSIILSNSYNADTAGVNNEFLKKFKHFEYKATHDMNIGRIVDFRLGCWLFLYCVLQSLPLLVIDVPGIKWTDNVEYFLCEPPRGGLPWARDAEANVSRQWYGVAGTDQYVLLPAEAIEFGIEGVYRRSHCWRLAEIWMKELHPEDDINNSTQSGAGASASVPPAQQKYAPSVQSFSSFPPAQTQSQTQIPQQFNNLPIDFSPTVTPPAMGTPGSNNPFIQSYFQQATSSPHQQTHSPDSYGPPQIHYPQPPQQHQTHSQDSYGPPQIHYPQQHQQHQQQYPSPSPSIVLQGSEPGYQNFQQQHHQQTYPPYAQHPQHQHMHHQHRESSTSFTTQSSRHSQPSPPQAPQHPPLSHPGPPLPPREPLDSSPPLGSYPNNGSNINLSSLPPPSSTSTAPTPAPQSLTPLEAPLMIPAAATPRSRSSSPGSAGGARYRNRQSVYLPLEALPMPAGGLAAPPVPGLQGAQSGQGQSRRVSTMTFDDILRQEVGEKKKGKKK